MKAKELFTALCCHIDISRIAQRIEVHQVAQRKLIICKTDNLQGSKLKN